MIIVLSPKTEKNMIAIIKINKKDYLMVLSWVSSFQA